MGSFNGPANSFFHIWLIKTFFFIITRNHSHSHLLRFVG